MVRGVIYLYTSPSGKQYVGQTTRERVRRKTFLNIKEDYCKNGTSAIDKARRKHGPENFKYQVIFSGEFSSKIEAKEILDYEEIKYIQIYNSYNEGYNSTKGGKSRLGYKYTDEQRNRISGKNHRNYGKKLPYRECVSLRKEILCYSKNNIFIAKFESVTFASKILGIDKSNISKVLKGKMNSTKGYKFIYNN